MTQKGRDDFVPAPGGGIDYGEITPEMGKAMRRQAGKIRLTHGIQNADGTGYGLVHIEANHGAQIRKAGFESVQDFVSHVASGFNEILQAAKGRQLLVAFTGGRRDVMFVQLDAADGGDFYRVNTAFPASRDYLEKQEGKGAKVLWGGSEPRPIAAGQQPLYAGSPEASTGQDAPIAQGQSGASVPQAPSTEQPQQAATDAKMAKYDQEAKLYGYSVDESGAITKGSKKLSPVVKEVKGRLRVESPDGNLLFSGAQTGEAFGKFLQGFWGAEKPKTAAPKPTSAAAKPAENDGAEDVPFSRSPSTQAAYEARIDALFSGEKASRTGVTILDSSDVMGLLGFAKVPMVLNEPHIANDGRTNHPEMTAKVWKQIPEWIENPAAVYTDPNHPGKLTIVAPSRVAGYPVLIAVEPNSLRGKPDHLLVTAFAKTTGKLPPIGVLAASGRLLYADTKKAPEIWRGIGDNPRPTRFITGAKKIVSEKSLADYRRESGSAMSRPMTADLSRAILAPTKTGVTPSQASAIVNAIRSKWGNAPDVVVVDSMQDEAVPQAVRDADSTQRSQGASGEPEGFWYKGKAYIVSGALRSENDVARVLFHEVLGHYGLRGTFGDELTPILLQLSGLRRKEVVAKARSYGLVRNAADGKPAVDVKTATDAEVYAAMSLEQRLEAAEEVLDEMAQNTPEIGFVKRAIAVIRQWLRRHVPGFREMALTDAEIIANFIMPARAFVERGPGGRGAGGVSFARAEDGAQSQQRSPEFRRWLDDWERGRKELRGAATFDEARQAAKAFQGLSLTNPNSGLVARVSRNSLDKMLSNKAVGKSQSPAAHSTAVANLDVLFGSALHGWSKPDAAGDPNIKAVHRLFAPMNFGGRMLLAKLTVKEMSDQMTPNRIYSVESVELNEKSPAAQWVAASADADGINLTSTRSARDIESLAQMVQDFNPDIRFSRTSPIGIQTRMMEAIPDAVVERLTDLTTSQRGFNRWWHGTVGTQLHKAKVNKDFGRVYDAVQDFMRDTSRMAILAADQAPDLLPQIDSLGDVKKLLPQMVNSKAREADLKATSDAMFDGTLRYGRDANGKPIKVDAPEDAGIVWTAAELKARGMSAGQVAMYQQARKAIDQSLDSLLAADVYRSATTVKPEYLGASPADVERLLTNTRKAAASEDPSEAVALVRNALDATRKDQEANLERLRKLAKEGRTPELDAGIAEAKDELAALGRVIERLNDKMSRIAELKAKGYAPLMRFGPYTVDVLNDQGERVWFGMYENQYEANRAARSFREKGLKVSQGVQSRREFELLKGVSPETAMLFAEMLGIEGDTVMQEWLQKATAQHSALRRLIHRKGVEGFDDDGSRVVAAFITSNSRAAARALHGLRISEAVDNVKQGDVKDEAVALANYVQNPKEEAQAIRSLLFLNYIGGSVASALVNLTQTLVQTLPYLSQFGGPAKAVKQVGDAMRQAVGKVQDADTAQALKRAEQDGIVKPQEIFQLQAEASRTLGSNLKWRAVVAVWGSFFQMAETFNRRTAFIAAYQMAKANGEADPFAFATQAVEETQGVFNKGNRPAWARGAVGATLFTFKTFTIQYVEFLKRLPTRERALALSVLVLLSGMRGLPFAEDAEDVLDTVAQGLGYNWVTRDQLNRFMSSTLGQPFADFLLQGASGTGIVPFDVSQRLGMGNMLPGTGLLKASETRKEDQVLEVFGVAGSFVRDALKGIPKLMDGEVLEATKASGPIAVRNFIKGVEMYDRGIYTDTRGRKVMDTDAIDAAFKTIGLQPSSVARESRAIGTEFEKRALFRNAKEEITEGIARGMFENDQDKVKAARDKLAEWNEKNPEAKIVLNTQAIRKRVTEMQKDRAQRFVKSSPRELRAQTSEALQ